MLLLGRSLGTIPGKRAAEEVDENIRKSFEVITARLFST
jgi:hypothetical protein